MSEAIIQSLLKYANPRVAAQVTTGVIPSEFSGSDIGRAPYPDLVKSMPHVAFEVDDMEEALKDQKVIIEPNCPSQGVTVVFIEVAGAPVELLQIDRTIRKDL